MHYTRDFASSSSSSSIGQKAVPRHYGEAMVQCTVTGGGCDDTLSDYLSPVFAFFLCPSPAGSSSSSCRARFVPPPLPWFINALTAPVTVLFAAPHMVPIAHLMPLSTPPVVVASSSSLQASLQPSYSAEA